MVEDHPERPWDGVAPPQCHWFGELDKWWCGGLPPPPWPHRPPGGYYDPAVFGEAGTTWEFTESALAGLEESLGENTLKLLLKKFGRLYTVQDSDKRFWTVPVSDWVPPTPHWSYMRYVRLSIIGKLGNNESVSHNLNLRTAPVVDVDQDAAAMQTLANQVRDIWTQFLTYAPGGVTPPNMMLTQDLKYTEVRAAYVESLAVGHKNVLPVPGHKPVIKYTYEKPTYLVPTQYAPFAANIGGVGTGPLPWEVALAVTLDSGRRGAANRGRIYFGPLDNSMMGAGGLFNAGKVQLLAAAFGSQVVTKINQQTGCDVHVVSKFWNDSIPVTSVRAGIVPDSQRRRRKNQLEAYGAAVPTPLV